MQTLFISYCWKDGTVYAEDLEAELANRFDVKRDKSSLKCNENIDDFMRKIADCDNVVIVLTEEYLRSKNCMKEVAYLSKQPEWDSKCVVLVIYDDIYSLKAQEDILSYWNKQKVSMEEELSNTCSTSLCKEEYESILDVCNMLEKFLSEVKHRNNPRQIRIVSEIIRLSERNREHETETVLGMSKNVQAIIESKRNTTLSELENETGFSKEVIDRLFGNLKDKSIAILDSQGHIHTEKRKKEMIDSYLKSLGKKSINELSISQYAELQSKIGDPL